MSWDYYIVDFFVVLLAIIAADYGQERFKAWRGRDLDINCDNCKGPLPLMKSPDSAHYLCRVCMTAYLTEHASDFTEEQIKKVQRGFRRRKKRVRGER